MTDLALSPTVRGVPVGNVDALWLATQQAIAARVAHEIKNTLNGVAVNVEVVRSRLARAAAGPAGVVAPSAASFAETASTEFERVTVQVEALLALLRPVRSPVDVRDAALGLARLLSLAAERDGGSLTVEGTDDGDARTSMGGETVRLLVARAMLAALEGGAAHQVRCVVTTAPGEGPRLTMTRTGSDAPMALPDDVARVAGEAGVSLSVGPETGLILTFPPAHGADD